MRHLIFPVLIFLILLVPAVVPASRAQLGHTVEPAQAFMIEPAGSVLDAPATSTLAEAKGAQRLVIILAEFPDMKHEITADKVRGIVGEMDRFYREASYGLTWIDYMLMDKWYQLQTQLSKRDIEQWDYDEDDMEFFEKEAIKAADNDVDFRNYDYVYLVATGGVWGHAGYLEMPTNDGVTSLKLTVVSEEDDMRVYAHELGHWLPSNYKPFDNEGLPDLYSYDASKEGEPSNIWVGPWDLMASSDNCGFSAWSKISLGWITPQEVRVKSITAVAVNLQPLEKDSGTRAVVVPLTSKMSYVIEVRRRIGYDKTLPAEGVLIYLVDLNMENGHGILKVIDGKPKTKTLDDAPFKRSDVFEDNQNHVYVVAALTDGVGFTIVVSGTRIQSIKDTDQDGLFDFIEVQLGTDPENPDTDSDGLKDGDEVNRYGTNPLNPDTDGDSLADGREIELDTDPLNPDTDNDGLVDGRELELGTNPKKTDADGLSDGDEADKYGTDPLKPDTDDDDLTDGEEIKLGTNPLEADTDKDGLPDGKELQMGTNPLKADTDGDYWQDGTDPAPTNPSMPNILIIAVVLIAVVVILIMFRKRERHLGVPMGMQAAPQIAPARAEPQPSAEVVHQFCIHCGSVLLTDSKFCQVCGVQQH
jgi:M6 family metalloprotease-like protein